MALMDMLAIPLYKKNCGYTGNESMVLEFSDVNDLTICCTNFSKTSQPSEQLLPKQTCKPNKYDQHKIG